MMLFSKNTLSEIISKKVICIKQGQDLKTSAAHPHPNFPWVPPRALGSYLLHL